MDNSLCVIKRYFDILGKLGHISDDETMYILTYLFLQEILHEDKDLLSDKLIHEVNICLKELENVSCIISSCSSCNNND
jgi:hypothetical protein